VESDAFDSVVSGLVLNFIPDVRAGIAEMARVARPGGNGCGICLGLCGRDADYAAVALDPESARFDEGLREPPLCEPAALKAHFEAAGLVNVEVRAVDAPAHFVNFDDYWVPFTGGQGSAPTYVMSLDEGALEVLRESVRDALPVGGDGSIDLIARAWAVSGACRTGI